MKPAWQTGAGKRFSNRLRSKHWSVEMIETYLWLQADERVAELSQGRQPRPNARWKPRFCEKQHKDGAARSSICGLGGLLVPLVRPGLPVWRALHHGLLDEFEQNRPAWQCVRGRRSWEHRLLWDARRRCLLPSLALPLVFFLVPTYNKVEPPGQGSTLPSAFRLLPSLACLPLPYAKD